MPFLGIVYIYGNSGSAQIINTCETWFDCFRPSNHSVLEFTTTRSAVFPKTVMLSSLSNLIFNLGG